MLLPALAFCLGLALLVWSADRFVAGAAATAHRAGIAPLTVGLIVIGVGTSAPEMLVSALAAWQQSPGLAVGNAVGSNIANIGLVLGATAVVMPLTVRSQTLRREFPILLLVIAVAGALLADGVLGRGDGLILSLGFAAVLAVMAGLGRQAPGRDPLGEEFARELSDGLRIRAALVWLAVGLVSLLLASRVVVWGATSIARALEVSELVIGLTIVAVGTSLPELAASVASALKREPDLAIGNLLGSNMFNLLPVLALPGLIAPASLDAGVLRRDYPLMMLFTAVLFVMALARRGDARVSRWEGAALLMGFIAYQTLLYVSA
ncbi:MAG: calcium/sodium antiporter [Gammaproteobacteria bacterium]|nr:calcium/sodium antiporter [Gammaproteobacteria bacterium]